MTSAVKYVCENNTGKGRSSHAIRLDENRKSVRPLDDLVERQDGGELMWLLDGLLFCRCPSLLLSGRYLRFRFRTQGPFERFFGRPGSFTLAIGQQMPCLLQTCNLSVEFNQNLLCVHVAPPVNKDYRTGDSVRSVAHIVQRNS